MVASMLALLSVYSVSGRTVDATNFKCASNKDINPLYIYIYIYIYILPKIDVAVQ